MLHQLVTVTEESVDQPVPRADLRNIYQGAPFRLTVEVLDPDGMPVDLSARTVRSQIRRYPGDPVLAADFDVDMVDAEAGRVHLDLTGPTTAAMASGPYAYDIKWNTDVDVSFFVAGAVTVEPEVTR